jgi:hypothetical protein
METGDDTLRSEILTVFRLGAVSGWVYIVMTGEPEPELYDDIEALIVDCPVVVREDTAITEWKNDHVVLSMGTGYPTFYKAFRDKFLQTFQCLSNPSPFYNRPDLFSVGEWVCTSRPGTYWGDVGLISSLSDDEDADRLTILLVPRITDTPNQERYSRACARPPLRKDLWPHCSDDMPLSTESEEETWMFGRDKMTKDGMLLRSFAPWELQKDMMDGVDLYLLPQQDTHFRSHLPPEDWSAMPPVCDPCMHFMQGERVEVAGHKGIIAGFNRSVGPEHEASPLQGRELFNAEIERIYSETWKDYVHSHTSYIVKQHAEYDVVFSLGVRENVTVVECDYFRNEVTIQLRPTARRTYTKEPLVS